VKDITPGKGIWFCEIYLSEKTGLIKSDGKKDQQHPLSGKGMLLSPLRATSNYRKRAQNRLTRRRRPSHQGSSRSSSTQKLQWTRCSCR